ncbi:C-type lectin domain family 10 member A-like isoform X2 [Carcharodon carcharias]|uniref:C-type lectin domain family 10 member A-like isoform X2 n=1 Tax=Carcharodon carcharias TaxID=13397 RepID=UPI001B7F78B4|nr:C-type lectin domain family 10 member A-like isoform X2 [Carcharodon carcharias]
MAGEHAYYDFENFNLDNEQKQQQAKQIPGSRFKSVFSGKWWMLLIFILLCVILILLITGVIRCSETNETVEEFQSQVQMQVSHALNNVSDKSELKELELRIRNEVTQLGQRVSDKSDLKELELRIQDQVTQMGAGACQNLQCAHHWIHFNGSCYFFSTKKASWTSSKMYCSLQQSNLVVINTIEEQHFVTMESDSKLFWIGLTDHENEDKWEWVDGTDYKTTPMFWAPQEPNNSGTGEDCAHTNDQGRWNDNQCSQKFLYICEQRAKTA